MQNNLPGFIPVFSNENRLEPGICGTLRHSDGPTPESVTQTVTPEDRRAADSAVEVLGAAATPAGFTVRTLKLLVTATRTGRTGSPSPGPGPGVTGRPVFKGSGPGPAGRRGVTVTVPVKSWTSNSRYNVLGELGTLDTPGSTCSVSQVANVTSVPKFCQ